jgi:branched-chain amino acid transport system ATP-binding protein
MRLELRGVSAGYGRFQVLRGIDLVVPSGRTVALLGGNGAGKTTLLRTVAGLVHPTAGSIWLDGRRIDHQRPHSRAKSGICLIPEGRGIFRNLTVEENLAMQAGVTDARSTVAQAVEVFPILGQRLKQLAGTLSGGEQQMLAVARAFVTDAEVVLADELSMGLAPIVVDHIFDAIDQLRRMGRSLLVVEQYVDRVLEYVEYVYVLHKGSIVFVGETAQATKSHILEQYMGEAVAS